MSACATCLIVFATILGPITLVFMSVSFGTDFWLKFDVDRSKLTLSDKGDAHKRYSHTRYRGLFRECYPGNDTAFLDGEKDVVDGFCFNVDYELPDNASGLSDEYFARMHLLRLFLAFYIIGLVFFVAAFVFGLILCCWRISRWAYVAGLFAYISAFSVAAAIAFFHGAEYLERNKLEDRGFYKSWPTTIKDATKRSYGWSYALGWVGMILAAFTATFFSLAGCYITSQRYEDRERLEHDARGGKDYPIAMEPVYALEDPYLVKTQPMYAASYHSGSLPHPRAYQEPYIVTAEQCYTLRDSDRHTWGIRQVTG